MAARNTYVRPMAGWWRRNPVFRRYLLREATSVLFVVYALILIGGVIALYRGEAAYADWLEFIGHPLTIILHLAVLAAAFYHSYTWFQVSPKAAPPLYIGANRLPDAVIIGAQYAALVIASVVLISLFIGR